MIRSHRGIWQKPILILLGLLLLVFLLPAAPLDPWNILSLKKLAKVIFALALIQAMGAGLAQALDARVGAILTGFLGGLVSSTATTVSLARRSKMTTLDDVSSDILTFLAATCAMLLEGVSLILLGTNEVQLSLLLIFLGPVVVTVAMMVMSARVPREPHVGVRVAKFEILPILKLSVFIVAILSVSKILQSLLGQSGLFILTFLVSLFEIHGSIIANIQLHDSGAFDARTLGGLLAISIVASYVSKMFLIFTLGSSALRSRVIKATGILFLSLIVSWIVFLFV